MFLALRKAPAAVDDPILTPFVDIFAVLTIYLMLSFAVSESASMRPLSDIVLPQSTTSLPGPQAVKLSLSRTAVRLENQLVMTLQGGQFAANDVDELHRVMPLYQALQREKLSILSSARSQAQLQADSSGADILYLEATRGLPYSLIERVLRTAAAAGFTKFRLAVYHHDN